ncbi:glycosyltransferase [Neorhizobium sp. T25_27]|jgi:sterol 3beta-glucosyltransferase|uniref:glycosyltransferase n=3 Tax=Neorhizobium TaxID=1525371 RepID=UPI000CF9F2E2|nr:glycosyltransferase [Neorhizobium sp. T25_27]
MRIAIHTYGTRGDVQPFVALSVALLAAGHEVQLAGPAPYAPLAVARSVPFHCLPPEMLNLIETREGKKAIAEGGGFLAGFKLLKHVRPLMEDLLRHEWETARDFAPDLIVYHPKSLASLHIAERLGCSAVLGSPLPISTPTSAFPSPVFPVRTLGPLNRLSHSLVANGAELLFAGTIARWRESCLKLPGRPARRPRPSMTLYAFSRHIVPAPSDWPPDVHVTGAWFLDSPEWEMPSTLEAFIAGGEAPVYVGFGSMPGLDPEQLTEIVVNGLALAGRRGLLATGGGALSASLPTSTIMHLDEFPHDRVLPLTAMALHHGGAGTTMACARAGIPAAICPFMGDQPFWALRMRNMGVAPAKLSRKHLSADRLARAIGAMDNPRMRERATTLGNLVTQETGTATAVRLLERLGQDLGRSLS